MCELRKCFDVNINHDIMISNFINYILESLLHLASLYRYFPSVVGSNAGYNINFVVINYTLSYLYEKELNQINVNS